MPYSRESPIIGGDSVFSSCEIVEGTPLGPHVFNEPHILMAASFSLDEFGRPVLTRNEHIARFCRWLAQDEETDEEVWQAVWEPDSDIPDAPKIEPIVKRAIGEYCTRGLLPVGAQHDIFGDAVELSDKRITREPDGAGPYADDWAHLDFIPAELACTGYFLSNRGGPRGWIGEFTYKGTAKPSYEDDVVGM
jgi:hypothetical protein